MNHLTGFAEVDMRPAWQQEFRGFVWSDMPGPAEFEKKVHFALFRRGLYDPELELVEADDAQLSDAGAMEGKLKRTREDGKVLVRPRRSKGVKAMIMIGRRAPAAVAEASAPEAGGRDLARQERLLARWGLIKAGNTDRLKAIDASALSCLYRAGGFSRGLIKGLRSTTMDRIEKALEKLEKQLAGEAATES